MQAFELNDLLDQYQQAGTPYYEFLKVPNLSMGLYILKAGEKDLQHPHEEDEVYYVLQGQAMIHVDGEDRPVQAGSTIHVAKKAIHYFYSISEDLHLLVFFAPAESEA